MTDRKSVQDFIQLWTSTIKGPLPTREQFSLWMALHSDDVVFHGIATTAKKFIQENGRMDLSYLTKYASRVMINKSPVMVPCCEKQRVYELRKKLYTKT